MIKKHNYPLKKSIPTLIILGLCLNSPGSASPPWGFFAHKKINKLAIYSLPPEMIRFYKRHSQEIENMAVLPDQRRYILDKEASRHYIDLDQYPISKIIGSDWEKIKKIYREDSLQKHGIVPWHIPEAFKNLRIAFMRRDTVAILKLSAELGHYIGDAHVPLHTTSNYDGQKTGQTGLHSFWESRIPEILDNALEDWVGPAEYLGNIQKFTWEWVMDSHQEVPKLIQKEQQISRQISPSKKYMFEKKGGILQKTPSLYYSKKYHQSLENQIEKRFQAAIKHISDAWYSAWVDAGQPIFQ
jgi:hypothetical protein